MTWWARPAPGPRARGPGVSPLDCDLILMDIEMETTTAGIQAAEHILEKHPDLMVIFLTAHETDEHDHSRAMGAGAVDYMVKGCPDEELLDAHPLRGHRADPMLDAQIPEHGACKEYSRLRAPSERSLLFFINTVAQLTARGARAGASCCSTDKKVHGDRRAALRGGGHRQDPDQGPAAQVRLLPHQERSWR